MPSSRNLHSKCPGPSKRHLTVSKASATPMFMLCSDMSRYPFIAVYLMASGRNGTFYIGVTSNLWARVLAHKQGRFDGFSKIHGCTRLVWFKRFDLLVE